MKYPALLIFAVFFFSLRVSAATPEVCEALLAPSDTKVVHVYSQLVLRTGLQKGLITVTDLSDLLTAAESDSKNVFELPVSHSYEREVLRKGLLALKNFALVNLVDQTAVLSEIQKLLRQAITSQLAESSAVEKQSEARVSTRPLSRLLEKQLGRIRRVEFSKDEETVTTLSEDGRQIIWNVETGKQVDEISGVPSSRISKSIKVGDDLLLFLDEKTLRFCNAANGSLVGTLAGHKLDVIRAFSSFDGKYVLSVPISESADTSIVWNVKTMQKQFSLPSFVQVTVGVIPNNHELVITTDNRGKISTWNLKDGSRAAPFSGHKSSVVALAVTPDSRTLVSASADGTVKLWDIPTRQLMRSLVDQNHAVKYLAVSPTGKYLITDKSDLLAQLWDLETLIGR